MLTFRTAGLGDATFNLTAYSFTATPSASQNANAVPVQAGPVAFVSNNKWSREIYLKYFVWDVVSLRTEVHERLYGRRFRDLRADCRPPRRDAHAFQIANTLLKTPLLLNLRQPIITEPFFIYFKADYHRFFYLCREKRASVSVCVCPIRDALHLSPFPLNPQP